MEPIEFNRRSLPSSSLDRLQATRNQLAQRLQQARSRINSNIIGRIEIPVSENTPAPIQPPAPQDVPEAPLENMFDPPQTPPAVAPEPVDPTPAVAPASPAVAPTGPTELGPLSDVTDKFSENIQPGSLLLADDFQDRPGGPTHGEFVTDAALETGFEGPVERLNVLALDGVQQNLAKQTQAAQGLTQPGLPPRQTLALVADATVASAGVVLESGIGALESAIDGGAQNSALNISMSFSPADITSLHVRSVLAGAGAKEGSEARIASENFVRAFGVELDDINSGDPVVANRSRAVLAERTGQFVESVFADSPEIQSRKKLYDQRLAEFESNNNSVVVVAGNTGSFVDSIEDTKGSRLNVSRDFQTSLLAHPSATVVGATSSEGGRERVADFSSDSQEVDLFASGTFDPDPRVQGDEQVGTSFSAPAVAATMARLHLQNPDLSSAQIESALIQNETHLVGGDGGLVASLNGGEINASRQEAPNDRLSLLFQRLPVQDFRSRFLDVFGT